MDGPSGASAPPPFLTKTYEMVDDSSTDPVVSWNEGGNSFIVWNQPEFERDILPNYFKHNNFSSFIRQLNTYGFRKIDPDQWEFANEEFRKGQRHLLKNIHRRKPTYSHSLPPNQRQGHLGTLSESEKQELEEEIGTLKREKNVLMMELHRHMQQQNKLDLLSQSLVEKLHLAEQRQQQILAVVGQTVNKPEIMSFLVQLCDANRHSSIAKKKRKLLRLGRSPDEADGEDNRIMDFQVPGRESSDLRFRQPLDVEAFHNVELCVNFWEMFFHRIGQVSGEEDIFDNSCQPSATIFESQAVSPCADAFSRAQSPGSSLPPSQLTGSGPSAELTEPTTLHETTVIAREQPRYSQLPTDRSRSSLMDMNLMPATPELRASKKNVLATSTGAPARVNDVFWEQFLTETPGSMDSLEVQSGMQESDDKNLATRSSENATFWWNKKNVDHLTEQMGQLTSAEKT
ncbi:unnamed protein product [Victoria cruziana]